MDKRILMCTDLDRTLIPNGPEDESSGARASFSALVSRPEITLVYVTGRHWALVKEGIEEEALPRPDYVIADVGTTIYTLSREGDLPENPACCSEWQQAIAPDWAGFQQTHLESWFKDLPLLKLQAPEKQNTYKLSYDLALDFDRVPLVALLRARLQARGVDAALVQSIDPLREVFLLDIIPARATKYHAIRFLMTRLDFSCRNTIFAGDSGNDLEVLVSEIPAVLVANSTSEVRDEASAHAVRDGTADALYIARGGWMNMNGNYSAGILEGVVHFFPETKSWLSPQA